MGQGQADVALQMLRECSINGDWLCLKNLHLVTGENYTMIVLTCPCAYKWSNTPTQCWVTSTQKYM